MTSFRKIRCQSNVDLCHSQAELDLEGVLEMMYIVGVKEIRKCTIEYFSEVY